MERSKFNDTIFRISIYGFIFIFVIIPIFFAKQVPYIEFFSKVSIPMYVALYSILWLSYKSEIKQSRDYLEKLKKEEKRLAKMKDATIEDELKEIENDYAHKEIGLRNAERRFDFVNITLRRFALLASIATIIDFFV